jgi:hypothetical protein
MLKWLRMRRPPEPGIADDGVISDSECFELLRRVARRDADALDSIDRKEKPIGLKCSLTDLVKIMKEEGAFFVSFSGNSSVNFTVFEIKSKEKWLLAKRSKFGWRHFDKIIVTRDQDGVMRMIIFGRPYIT